MLKILKEVVIFLTMSNNGNNDTMEKIVQTD